MRKSSVIKLLIVITTLFLLTPTTQAKKTGTTWNKSPTIKIHPKQESIGEIVTIHGSHFTPIKDTKVTLYLYTVSGTQLMEIDEFKTDERGRFRDTFMIPAMPADTYLLKAIENESGLTATTMITFTPPKSPEITIHPEQGQIGEIVKIRGTHFTPIKDTKVTLYLYTVSGTQLMEIDEFKTDKNGRFRDTFMIPARHADTYLLKAIENESGLTATTTITIIP